MYAWLHTRYGPPEVLELGEAPKPELEPDTVLVRVRAVSVNAAEWYAVAGSPVLSRLTGGLRAPKSPLVGVDFSGVVEAVGPAFDGELAPGDEVFGGRTGAFAEYVAVKNAVARKPPNVSFEEAAGVGIAGTTALQALRDHARVQPGQKVLVNGASGGVGTFAVQIAKALGAEVTAVCSTAKVDQARELGADRVIDYTREDFTRGDERYDALIDVGGGRRFLELARVLTPEAVVVVTGVGNVRGGPVGPLAHIARMKLGGLRARQRCVFFIAKLNRADTEELATMLASGRIRTAVERVYPFEQLPEALRRLGEGHTHGKLVIAA